MYVLCRHMRLNVNTLFRNQFPNVRTIWESPKIMSASALLPSASSPAGKELFQPRCEYRWPWPTFAPRGPELAGKLGLSCGLPVLKAWSNSQVAGAWGVSPFLCQLRSPTRNTHPLCVHSTLSATSGVLEHSLGLLGWMEAVGPPPVRSTGWEPKGHT